MASAPSATVATRMRSPGLAAARARGEHQARVGGAGLSDGEASGSATWDGSSFMRCATSSTARGFGAVDDDGGEVRPARPRLARATVCTAFPSNGPKACVRREAFLPGVREALVREAATCRGTPRVSDAVATISAITPSDPRTKATAPSPFCARPCPRARRAGVRDRRQGVPAPPRTLSAPWRIALRPARIEPVRSAARISTGSWAAAPMVAALSFSP